MKVRYSVIYLGRPISEQIVEMDGTWADNIRKIEDTQNTGVDALALAHQGKGAVWVEAIEV